ncbi:hypothetical protein E4U02_06000 [Microbacterium paludicola]|uniref:Fucose isomerase n=1 Tax=Microbacterium paludicola TaxID=300019 RepID=A0A4Y9FVY2_9MICO|nr:hypothetical protein [Microbacterium paludicola]MBF0815956.1 hypothetical protein [Microbacterium paludicola]TFU33422.1 hypothetical protein E4U02_06000 [Microbacterium paludicola]
MYLEDIPQQSFHIQLEALRAIAGHMVAWLEPCRLPEADGVQADAVIVPDMSGAAYRQLDYFQRIRVPILVVTSEFGTVSMWDWEIRDFLARRGVPTIAPTARTEFEDILRALGAKATLRGARMLAYLDDLGAGKQPDIFKRFYWYEDDCAGALADVFGTVVEKRSFRELAARAAAVPASRVTEEIARVSNGVQLSELGLRAREEALRMKLALSDELDETPGVIAAGINCLNESETSATTPCLAWNLLFEERGLIWGCEADLTSMITKYLVNASLDAPVMMTNLYPFLMGQAALKHEKIPHFPPVSAQPENHILAAHCGFFGIVPQRWASQWAVRPRVLEIVDPRAHALDARFPEGDVTLVKITSTMDRLSVTPAVLSEYAQFENSDCLNGAVLRVEDGYRFVENLPSHHAIIAVGDLTRRLDVVSRVLDLETFRI